LQAVKYLVKAVAFCQGILYSAAPILLATCFSIGSNFIYLYLSVVCYYPNKLCHSTNGHKFH